MFIERPRIFRRDDNCIPPLIAQDKCYPEINWNWPKDFALAEGEQDLKNIFDAMVQCKIEGKRFTDSWPLYSEFCFDTTTRRVANTISLALQPNGVLNDIDYKEVSSKSDYLYAWINCVRMWGMNIEHDSKPSVNMQSNSKEVKGMGSEGNGVPAEFDPKLAKGSAAKESYQRIFEKELSHWRYAADTLRNFGSCDAPEGLNVYDYTSSRLEFEGNKAFGEYWLDETIRTLINCFEQGLELRSPPWGLSIIECHQKWTIDKIPNELLMKILSGDLSDDNATFQALKRTFQQCILESPYSVDGSPGHDSDLADLADEVGRSRFGNSGNTYDNVKKKNN